MILESFYLTDHTHYFEEVKDRRDVKGCDTGKVLRNRNETYWWCQQPHEGQSDTIMLTSKFQCIPLMIDQQKKINMNLL